MFLYLKNLIINKFEFIWLPILIYFGTFISFNFLGKESLRLDESQSIWQVNRSFNDIFPIVASDVHLPIYNMILHWWRSIVGTDIFNQRHISLIFFLFGIIVIFFLAKLVTNNKNIGLFTATLFAISPYMNWYASELRMYSLLVLVTMISHYFFLRIYFKLKFLRLSWVFYFLISLIGIYTHYFFSLILFSQLIFYFLFRYFFPKNTFRNLIIVASTLILAFIPWVVLVIRMRSAGNQTPLLIKPSTVDFFNIYSQQLFGFQIDYINSVILSFWPILGLLSLLLLKKKIMCFSQNLSILVW